MEGVRTQLVDNVPVIQLRQGMIIVSLIIIVLPGEPVVPPHVAGGKVSLALATDNLIREIVAFLMSVGQVKAAINKKAVGGAMMGDGNAMVVVPVVGQLVLHLAVTVNRPMAVGPPETAATDRVVLP